MHRRPHNAAAAAAGGTIAIRNCALRIHWVGYSLGRTVHGLEDVERSQLGLGTTRCGGPPARRGWNGHRPAGRRYELRRCGQCRRPHGTDCHRLRWCAERLPDGGCERRRRRRWDRYCRLDANSRRAAGNRSDRDLPRARRFGRHSGELARPDQRCPGLLPFCGIWVQHRRRGRHGSERLATRNGHFQHGAQQSGAAPGSADREQQPARRRQHGSV